MRIISGKYGHRRFSVPSSFGARPTTDFAKENLFNVLMNLINWEETEALDLFSGTGSIAFELLSRGCRTVTAVEKNHVHATFIAKVGRELKEDNLNLICGDAFRFLNVAQPESFDFIFADPPYALPELASIPELILKRNLLKSKGILVMEHPKEYNFSALPGFFQQRAYGSVNFSLFSI
ncbi:MAG: RsmD family RNA methyltransferase [Massilibacteroides sp.]|nr:RsmD family RNA methyltransferase [Massilibacteroides sp.]MDD3062087.1 RsmD family RNA methyltransferase [Massilibacteroides sp.]MDD4114089.1 RsmD family RNA methyltransferase [Massilibacteroides sp.]MDD4659631.1 RsmD family RNA methyltransferase [Massilibacteroides sp.]